MSAHEPVYRSSEENMFFYSVSVFVILLCSVDCASLQLDENTKSFASEDLQAAETIIRLDDLDPRREGVSNSFSLVQTPNIASRSPQSRGSHDASAGNNKNNENGKHRRRQLTLSDDESSADEKPITAKPSKKLTKAKSPKNVDKIVESEKLEGDSTKSGKYFSPLDDEEGYDEEKHYGKEAGKKFAEAHKAEEGKKAQKNFQKEEGYDKAEEEKQGKEENKAEVSEKEADKKAHLEEEKKFGKEYKGQEGEQGVSHSKAGARKKAKKRTGYRKTHHKDEYKNDEIFYDEEHNKEENEEHATEKSKHGKEVGQTGKKTSLEEGYHDAHGAKAGKQHKGKKYEQASGHKKLAGQEKHEDEHEEYGKKGAEKKGTKFGHAEGGGSGLFFR